jgi:hypothetical protein
VIALPVSMHTGQIIYAAGVSKNLWSIEDIVAVLD